MAGQIGDTILESWKNVLKNYIFLEIQLEKTGMKGHTKLKNGGSLSLFFQPTCHFPELSRH
jgi:hypothetical protein